MAASERQAGSVVKVEIAVPARKAPTASSAPETMIGRVPARMNIFVATVEPDPMPTLTGTYDSQDSRWE